VTATVRRRPPDRARAGGTATSVAGTIAITVTAIVVLGAALAAILLVRQLRDLRAAIATMQAEMAPWLQQLRGHAAVTTSELSRLSASATAVRPGSGRRASVEDLVAGRASAVPEANAPLAYTDEAR